MFKTSQSHLEDFNNSREHRPLPIRYGIRFLDDVTGGVFPDDLVIVTAKTGMGKTEFLTQVLQYVATKGKKAHMFALEAHRAEIEARIKFRNLANAFYLCTRPEQRTELPNYQDWKQGLQDELLGKYEKEVDIELKKWFSNVHTFYTDETFTVDTFEAQMHKIRGETDLVLLDHLHFMDLEGVNENKEFKRVIKQIKNVVTFWRKPIIAAAQLRKVERGAEALLPDVEDVHGSSDIVKVATHVIALAPAWDQETIRKNIFPTYIRVLKNRTDMSRTHNVGLCGYDVTRNQYNQLYELGKLNRSRSEFVRIPKEEYPQWAMRVAKKEESLQTNFTLSGEGNDKT